MFHVQGYVNRTFYTATVGDPATVPGGADTAGIVSGSPVVVDLLTLHDGQPIRVTPTHGDTVLDLHDPASVLAGLYALTDVVTVTGDAPDLAGTPVLGAVY